LPDDSVVNSSRALPALEAALTKPNGLLAAGGDLSPERLIEAYRCGYFPGLALVNRFFGGAPIHACAVTQ